MCNSTKYQFMCEICILKCYISPNVIFETNSKIHKYLPKWWVLCQFNRKVKFTWMNPIIHNRTNTGEQPHQWSPYDVFPKKGNLTIHTRIQAGEKTCQSSHCDKAFLKSSKLIVHTGKHTGNKIYQCSQCNNTFSTNRSTFYTYKKSHWRETTSMQLVWQGLLN